MRIFTYFLFAYAYIYFTLYTIYIPIYYIYISITTNAMKNIYLHVVVLYFIHPHIHIIYIYASDWQLSSYLHYMFILFDANELPYCDRRRRRRDTCAESFSVYIENFIHHCIIYTYVHEYIIIHSECVLYTQSTFIHS